jgi:Rieske Fe-S protein
MDRPAVSCASDQANLSRREFVCLCGTGAGAALLAGCGITDSNFPHPPESVSLTLTVGDYPALAAIGGVVLVADTSGSPLAVIRTGGAGGGGGAEFLALSRICTHQGGRIDRNGSGFKCTNHGATFDPTGTWIGGQSTTSMRSYPTSYDGQTLVIG